MKKILILFIFMVSLFGVFAIDYDNISFTNEEFYNGAVTQTKVLELTTGRLAVAYSISGNAYLKLCDLDGTNCNVTSSGFGTIPNSLDIFEDTTNNILM